MVGLLPVEALVGALTVTLDVDRGGEARTGVLVECVH